MNTHKSFIVGRRYYNNSGNNTYRVIGERYTRSGARYITLISDRFGCTIERKCKNTINGEFIDPMGGAIKCVNGLDEHIVRAVNETEYMVLNEKQQRFLNGEEVYVSFDELKRWINTLPLNSHMGFKFQRDPRDIQKQPVKRDI
jgi:hypothetical protein